MLELYRDTFASQAAKEQPIFDMKKVSTTLDGLKVPYDQRIAVERRSAAGGSMVGDAKAAFHGVSFIRLTSEFASAFRILTR